MGFLALAVAPTLLLNNEVYGGYLIHGTKLLNEYIIFNPESSGGLIGILFPSTIDFSVVVGNIFNVLIGLNPLLFALAILGLASIKYNKYSFLYLLFVVYLLIYRGSSNTFAEETLGFNNAMVRYWIFIFLAMGILAVRGLLRLPKWGQIPTASILLIISIVILFAGLGHSLGPHLEWITASDVMAENLKHSLPDNALVYTSYNDKFLSPHGINTATWWTDGLPLSDIANSMVRQKRPVYAIQDKNTPIDELNNVLEPSGYVLKCVGDEIYLLVHVFQK